MLDFPAFPPVLWVFLSRVQKSHEPGSSFTPLVGGGWSPHPCCGSSNSKEPISCQICTILPSLHLIHFRSAGEVGIAASEDEETEAEEAAWVAQGLLGGWVVKSGFKMAGSAGA